MEHRCQVKSHKTSRNLLIRWQCVTIPGLIIYSLLAQPMPEDTSKLYTRKSITVACANCSIRSERQFHLISLHSEALKNSCPTPHFQHCYFIVAEGPSCSDFRFDRPFSHNAHTEASKRACVHENADMRRMYSNLYRIFSPNESCGTVSAQ